MPGVVAQHLQDLHQQAIMREESEAIDRSDPQIREWNSRILDEAFWQGSSDAQGNKPHAYEKRTAPIDPEIKAAYEEGREQWQHDQLSHLSTPELHDRWVSVVREFWAESETLDFHNGSPISADRAAELEAQTKLIYTEMNKPERAAELHELEQAPPWIEQTVTPENSLRDRVSALSDFHLYDAYNGTEQELDSQRDWNIQHPERQVSTVALESQAEIIAAEFRSRPSLNQSRDQQGLSY